MSGKDQSIARRVAGYGVTLGVASLLIGTMATGIAMLHWRATAKASVDPSPPLPVATSAIVLEDGYRIEQRFAGRLEPKRETPLAFERGGLVIDVRVEEGDAVEAGQVIAALDTAPMQARRAGLEADRRRTEAELELARLTTQRQADLNDKGFSSAQRYDEARLNAEAIGASIASIDAAIRAIDIDLAKSEIRAPFAGKIAERYLDEGRIVSAGEPVVRVLETGGALLRIGLAPGAARDLEPGQAMPLHAGDRDLEARFVARRPDLTSATRTVPILLEVDDAEGLPFGELVELAVSRDVLTPGAWVPLQALSEGRNGLWSLLTTVDEDGELRARREAVEILHVAGERAYVRGSFGDGDRLIVDGGNRLVAGQRVRPADRG